MRGRRSRGGRLRAADGGCCWAVTPEELSSCEAAMREAASALDAKAVAPKELASVGRRRRSYGSEQSRARAFRRLRGSWATTCGNKRRIVTA